MFGLEDPWIWGSYVVGFIGVVFCVVYGWKMRDEGGDE